MYSLLSSAIDTRILVLVAPLNYSCIIKMLTISLYLARYGTKKHYYNNVSEDTRDTLLHQCTGYRYIALYCRYKFLIQ